MADDKKNLHKGYVHYIPAVEEKDDWDKDLTFVLIRTLDELRVHDVEHDFTAWDTETSGLDPDMDYLVGFSFSFDGKTGYYVPVAHDDMALGTEAVEIFYSILKKTRKTQFLFNCRFDQRFLEAALKHKGWTLDGMSYYDVQNAIWLADTNVVMPSLKASARHFLGWKPKTFDETLGDAVTFQHVPAEDAYFYACTDALMTYQLALVSNKFYRENLPASRFDNNMLYPLMRLENTPQRLDTEYLKSLVPQVEAIIERTREEVYRLAGTQFNLNAPQQFGKILVERFGVDTGARTATGAMKADLKTIDAWMVKHNAVIGQDIKDFIKAYKEYKKTVKFKSSYLDKYIKAASEQDIYPVRFSYKTNSVPTGRLSCGTSAKNKFFTNNNVQCLEENTSVITSEGIKPIKHVNTGDLVWTGSAFVPCVQLGSKQKRCETVWTYFGKITASLEHKFYTLNLYTFELEWDALASAIAQGKPIVRNTEDGGFTLRELLENETFKKSMLLKPELSGERIKELENLYADIRFDMIRKTDNFWYPNIIPPKVTVYDLEVPTYERFTANGFIVHNSTPKPHAVLLKGRKATEQEIAEKKDILGWYFSNDIPDEEAKGLVEGMDPDNLNIRRAFLSENDQCYVVSIDMCLEGGSPVQTKHGYMGICEIKPGDEVLSPQGWVTVSRVMRTGVEKVIKVFPDNGGQAIYCTENHPFVINGEKVKAKDIKGKVPSVPFHAYVKESVERNKVIECLSYLKQCKTIKEASHYVLEHDLKLLIEDALETYTRAEVSKWCGIRVSSFGHFMNDLGIQPTGKEFCYRQSKFYNNVFEGESTPTSAYLFGFILGDGNISRRRGDYLTLNISSKDEAHLRQICNIFGEDLNIRHNEKKGCEWWCLNIPSRDICNRLLELGISERKSTEPSHVNFEWLGDNFRHFIRGLFDADGYVRITSVLDVSFVGHDSYITEIKKRIEGQWSYKYTSSLSHLSLLGTVEQRKFIYEYLYQEATIWLQRKRDIIESWYQDKFGDLVFPVWNCTVDTTEHQLYVQCTNVHQCAEELRIVANLYHEDTWINAFNSGADVHKACYSPDTEFYVKSHGWMYAENITPEMEIAYYDVRSDSFKFTKADKRATQKGRDVYVRSGVFNVTGNHRMYVNFDTQGYHIERADNLKNCGNAKQRFHMKTAVGTRVEFSKERNKDNATAFALGFLSSIDKEFDGTRMIVKCSTLYPEVFQILKDYACNSTNKTLFAFSDKGVSYLTSLGFSTSLGRVVDDAQILTSRNRYRGFICGLLHGLSCRKDSEIYLGDGSDLHGRTYVKDKALADWIQWHLTCNGYSCRVTHNVLSDRYALYIESRQDKDVCMTFHSVKGHSLTNGGIYSCFEVPSGLLVTRYDGRITVNGNTAIKLFGEENYTKDARKKAKCLSGDTMVHTVDGRSIQIRNLVSEETHMNAVEGNPVDIRYKDIKISTPDGWSDVTHWIYNGFRETLKITIDRRLMLEVTPDHLVGKYEPDAHEDDSKKYTLVRADSLSVGDMVLWDYCPMRITSIQKGYSDVYDITVDNVSHTFHANGVVVHNCASFGILYGSGAQGFNNSFPDMTLDECRDFMKKFKDALPAISQGQAENIAYARQYGDINTGFGRHRRVKFWLSSPDRAKQAFGERTTKNTAVQGTAADVLKIIFCRLWEKVFKPYPQVKFMSTIHDEVNFSIPIELAREVIPLCVECMTIEREDWPVPLKCSLSLSRTDLGSLIPFTYDAATDTYEPEWDTLEVKPKVTHTVEANVVATEDENNFDDCVYGVSLDEIDF